MLKLEINKELVVSTCHLSKAAIQSEIVTENKDSSVDSWLTRLHVDSVLEQLTYLDDIKSYGDLNLLLQLAQDNDCAWLVLDGSGSVLEGFAVYQW